MSADITDPTVDINYFFYKRDIHITRIAFIFLLNINYGQQYKLIKLLSVFMLMLNIIYTH